MAIERDILLSKWYNGDISPEELGMLKEEYDLEELDASLKMIQRLELDVLPADEGWSYFEKRILNQEIGDPIKASDRKSWLKPIFLTILMAILGITAYLYLSSRPTVIENKGQKEYQYAFSEGSESIITPGSSISYDEENFGNNRTVELVGEALFNVEKGEQFEVKTTSGRITVLGTSFDVWQISDHSLRVECYEGRVSVKAKRGQEVLLNAGESVYLRNQNFDLKEEISHLKPDWKRERKQYVGISVKDLISDLSRFYDNQLILEDIDLSDLFTGVIPINDINKTSDYLATTLEWRYEKKGKTYIFQRQ